MLSIKQAAYQQIRNILYSIADREVISQKMPGGSKVQIPSLFFEERRLGLTKIKGKKGYTSDVLKFYSEGKDKTNVCEIMIGRWFESDMSDEALLEYLNNTPEGQKILSGLAYRIPTQKQNSIEAFVIKQFLPKEFGDIKIHSAEGGYFMILDIQKFTKRIPKKYFYKSLN